MDKNLPQHIHALASKVQDFSDTAKDAGEKDDAVFAAGCIHALALAVQQKTPIFAIEPWHAVSNKAPLSAPGEMLLRLKTPEGVPMPPYPAIMAFYDHGMAAEIDTILVLCALRQFIDSDEQQVSVNISGKSLRDSAFIKNVLPRIEALKLPKERQVIFEIHESGQGEIMSGKVLDLCRGLRIGFAMDDLGLSMNDIMRLGEFEQIADFIKLDRQTVSGEAGAPALDQIMRLITTTLPFTSVVAEGVRSAEQALDLVTRYPAIHYVQGLYLPARDVFAREYEECRTAAAAAQAFSVSR